MWYHIIRNREHTKTKEDHKMYETVKTVKGYDIIRRKGTHGFYYVYTTRKEKSATFYEFHTIKAAAEFIEENL